MSLENLGVPKSKKVLKKKEKEKENEKGWGVSKKKQEPT